MIVVLCDTLLCFEEHYDTLICFEELYDTLCFGQLILGFIFFSFFYEQCDTLSKIPKQFFVVYEQKK